MNFQAALLVPEIYQLLVILALFVQTLGGEETNKRIEWVPAAAGLGMLVAFASIGAQGVMFWDSYKVDALSQFFKLAVAVGFFIAVLNAAPQKTLDEEKRADYFMFLSFSAWGLMLLASSVELITIFVSLEISSYSLYAVIPLRGQDKRAAEAGIKYILFGALATAVSLYGFSYILAGQHTTYLSELAVKSWSFADNPMAALGLLLFLAGMFYKLALFPFHFWCPDVYEGASNETAAFVATLPKLGAVVILVRLAALLKPGLEVTTTIALLGAASMTFGNLTALAQSDLKRLLGYSSVAHAGYVTLGLVAGTAQGLAAAAFYSLVYIVMNLSIFWVICRLSPDGRNLKLDDLNGLYKRSAPMALFLAVAAFALVGLPPTAGFTGKLFLLSAAWSQGYDWLVIVAAVNTAISIFYYLNIVRHAYTKDEEGAGATVAHVGSGALVMGGLMALAILWLGTMPAYVFSLAEAAGRMMLP